MKTTMEYGANRYGNEQDAPEYSLVLAKDAGATRLRLTFAFHEAAFGRGVGDAKGKVESVSIVIPREVAALLARSITSALSEQAAQKIVLSIDEAKLTESSA